MTALRLASAELRVLYGAERIEALRHDPRTLATALTGVPPGQWLTLWPGLVDERVFYSCGSCGAQMALPLAVQVRRSSASA